MPTIAQQMVEKYEALLLANAGVESVVVDGRRIAFHDLEKKHAYWSRRREAELNKRPVVNTLDIGEGF